MGIILNRRKRMIPQNNQTHHQFQNHKTNSTQTVGMLTYKTNSHMKQCHANIFSKIGKSGGIDLRYNWSNVGMTYMVKDIVVWDIPTFLDLSQNGQPTILKQIVHINFPSLHTLKLSGNSLDCVEFICDLRVPKLKILQLKNISSNNKISNMRGLRKLYCPELQKLIIENYTAEGLSQLSELHCADKGQIDVEIEHRGFAKLQTYKNYSIRAKYEGHSKQPNKNIYYIQTMNVNTI